MISKINIYKLNVPLKDKTIEAFFLTVIKMILKNNESLLIKFMN